MDFELKPLSYALNALEPYLGAETVRLHREKHRAGYLKELELLIRRTPQAEEPLEKVVASATGHLFDVAAQVWNRRLPLAVDEASRRRESPRAAR